MLVYGIRCEQSDLAHLPKDTVADYYLDYGLLVFPTFSKPTCITSHGYKITPEFLTLVRLIAEKSKTVVTMDFEHPYVSDTDAIAIKTIQDVTGSTNKPDWYHVPKLVTVDSTPRIEVS